MNLSNDQLENVKHVLFGNQKQADVINDAVVHIVAEGLIEFYGTECLQSEENVVEHCRKLLQESIDGTPMIPEVLIKLIAGYHSYSMVCALGPRIVDIEQPNPESPKHTFRVIMLGDEPVREEEPITPTPMSGPIRIERSQLDNMSCYDAACAIRDMILPVVPDAVKAEIPDEFAQALYCAEAFYKYDDSSESNSIMTKSGFGVIEMFENNKSLKEIMDGTGLTLYEVKYILKNNGYEVF